MRLISKILIINYVVLFILLAQQISFGQKPNFMFSTSLKPDTITIGDRVELTIKATYPVEFDLQFPHFADSLIQGVEVLGNPRIDTLKSAANVRDIVYRLQITSFDSGEYRIPGFRLAISDGSVNDTVTTTPLWLTVNTLKPDTTVANIYDIKPPISQPITFAEIAPWLGGGLLLAALIALIVLYFIRRKKNQPLFFPRKPQEPAHVIALRELEKLREGQMWNTQNHKHYQSVLTDIIRAYIEGRFGVPAMEQTTFEIVASLRKKELSTKQLVTELDEVLSLADLTKFAKFSPSVQENKDSLDFSFRFVNETKVEEVSSDDSKIEVDDNQKNASISVSELPVESLNTEAK